MELGFWSLEFQSKGSGAGIFFLLLFFLIVLQRLPQVFPSVRSGGALSLYITADNRPNPGSKSLIMTRVRRAKPGDE